MIGMRVGVEIQAPPAVVASAVATLPWMSPERIELDESRTLVLLETSFLSSADARAYAERRVRKAASGMGLDLEVLSTEAFPPSIDLRDHAPTTERWAPPDRRA